MATTNNTKATIISAPKGNINTALLQVQKEIGAIKKDKSNPFYKSSYFDINSLLEVVKPVLNVNGLILMQALTSTPLGGPALKTEIICSFTGESLSDICPLPDVSDAQKMGSAITYFRRYAIQSLLALEAEDDDGNDAIKKPATKRVPIEKVPRVYPTPESEGINLDDPPFEDTPEVKKDDLLDDLLN